MTDVKRAVTDLPGKISPSGKFVMNPARRVGFQVPHEVRERNTCWDCGQEMQTVGWYVDQNDVAAEARMKEIKKLLLAI